MSTLDRTTPSRSPRRHPSAGNLGPRPLLLAPGTPPPGLPPTSFPHGLSQQTEFVEFGPDLDHATHQRLLGNLEGRRVLELGAGAGAGSVAMARAGARVIAVEPSPARLSRARALSDEAEVRVEFHQADLADLAFIRA
ncbi:MAG: class I SAM-dependent methyltransferase, partial [Microthrixaceae bacterium]